MSKKSQTNNNLIRNLGKHRFSFMLWNQFIQQQLRGKENPTASRMQDGDEDFLVQASRMALAHIDSDPFYMEGALTRK